MDSKFRVPGTSITFGVDPILALVPGLGSIAGMVISVGIVAQAVRFGARGWTLTLMMFNLVVDAIFGSIPLLGTLFDVFYKANNRNVRLLERHVIDPGLTTTEVRRGTFVALMIFLAVGTVFLVALVGGTVWLVVWLLN